MTDVHEVLQAYVKVLTKEQELKVKQQEELEKLLDVKQTFENFLLKSAKELEELPEEIFKLSPYIAWKLTPKTDKSVIDTHMIIDDVILPGLKKEYEAVKEKFVSQKNELENWALAQLINRKASNFSVKGSGRSESRTDVKYSINNKTELVKWAIEEDVVDDLTITIRPNSTFMARVVEETGALPPAVSSFKEKKVVFVKA